MRCPGAHSVAPSRYDACGGALRTEAQVFKQAMATDWGLVGIAMGFASVYTPIR